MTDSVHHETGAAATSVQAANLALRFVLELAALAALAYWGFRTGRSLIGDVALGVGAPLLAALVWGVWAAPKSSRRLTGPALTAVQLAVLGAGAVALVAARRPLLGAILAALVAANTIVMHVNGGGDNQHR